MRTAGGLLTIVTCAVACLIAPQALAMPVPGAYYVAQVPGTERASYLKVSADGRRLTTYLFAVKIRCSDGRSRDFGLDELREKRFGLTPDGRFDHTSSSRRYTHRQRGVPAITGRGSARAVGTFTRDQASIRFTNTFAGGVSCVETIPLNFNRVGTSEAPASDSLMTTGRYVFSRSGSGSRIRVSNIRTVGPARVVEGLRVNWSVRRCARGGRDYSDNLPFHPLLLSPAATLNLTESTSYSLGRGLRARLRLNLTLRFRRRGSYELVGNWRATSRVYRRGKQIDTCRTAQRFRALASG